MADANGYITVYESSDGGSGDEGETTWQFFVDQTPVITNNRDMAVTASLAIQQKAMVRATYQETKDKANYLSQLRLELKPNVGS